MAKESADRITIDLFAEEKRRGRPKTNPLPRQAQLKVNKRNQIKRDRQKGLKRVELKVDSDLFETLNELAKAQSVSRSELIETILKAGVERLDTANSERN
ncbi:LexA regulated protein [Gallaecimonas kandeliae]|uniref:LexA regulated protein n=1 Tax=Gallaecimonas kandeliae TaxID=3029055 RepID=UPI0026487307|nr:LexA regulated protein [Gallaecimonas kandeliae]WKE67193.1 LexA regulated protein [Gallaecimonas kandeliae]